MIFIFRLHLEHVIDTIMHIIAPSLTWLLKPCHWYYSEHVMCPKERPSISPLLKRASIITPVAKLRPYLNM